VPDVALYNFYLGRRGAIQEEELKAEEIISVCQVGLSFIDTVHHSAVLTYVLEEQYDKYGPDILKTTFDRAEKRQITKLKAPARTGDEKHLALLMSNGFVIEGEFKNEFWDNDKGEYYNVMQLARFGNDANRSSAKDTTADS
jgi:RimJ/RimL family protein N-acetyltransferase